MQDNTLSLYEVVVFRKEVASISRRLHLVSKHISRDASPAFKLEVSNSSFLHEIIDRI